MTPPPAAAAADVGEKTIGWKQGFLNVLSKIWSAVKWIFKALVGVGLFIANPFPFVIGFALGVIRPNETRDAIDKVKAVWDTQPWTVVVIFGAAAFLALPITMAASSLAYGSALGCHLSESAISQLAPQEV